MSVLITQTIHPSGIKLLKKHFLFEIIKGGLNRKKLINKLRGKEALICSINDNIDKDIINAADALKVISNVAVGYNNIDIKAAAKKGIVVTNTPNVLTQSVVEFIFAHILSISRHLVASDNYVRAGKFKQWSLNLFVGNELRGKTLGIVGLGRIGRSLVPIALNFGMKILYTNLGGELTRYKRNPNIRYTKFHEILRRADYLVLLVPLTPKTKHLITYYELRQMKKKAVLINMSRGLVVSEKDLIKALRRKDIAGACLDVYEYEPKISPKLIKKPNTILTPHIGSSTAEAREKMAIYAAQNVIDVLKTGICKNIVNKKNNNRHIRQPVAIICAAGEGKRMRPLTKNYAKPLLKVGRKLIIEYLLDQLSICGLTEVVIVVGYKSSVFRRKIGNRYKNCRISYVHNPDYITTNNIYSLWLAKDKVKNGMIFFNADTIRNINVLRKILNDPAPNSVIIDDNIKLDDDAMKVYAKKGRLVKIGKNFSGPVSGWSFGIHKLSQKDSQRYFAIAEKMFLDNTINKNISFVTPLQKMALRIPIKVISENKYKWIEIDTIQEYRKAKKIINKIL